VVEPNGPDESVLPARVGEPGELEENDWKERLLPRDNFKLCKSVEGLFPEESVFRKNDFRRLSPTPSFLVLRHLSRGERAIFD